MTPAYPNCIRDYGALCQRAKQLRASNPSAGRLLLDACCTAHDKILTYYVVAGRRPGDEVTDSIAVEMMDYEQFDAMFPDLR